VRLAFGYINAMKLSAAIPVNKILVLIGNILKSVVAVVSCIDCELVRWLRCVAKCCFLSEIRFRFI